MVMTRKKEGKESCRGEWNRNLAPLGLDDATSNCD